MFKSDPSHTYKDILNRGKNSMLASRTQSCQVHNTGGTLCSHGVPGALSRRSVQELIAGPESLSLTRSLSSPEERVRDKMKYMGQMMVMSGST